ncbi:MAG: GDP-mannose 4,6-dehydratase [archaeon]
MKKALITGITGQDGSYLAEFLLNKDYEVHGIARRSSSFNRGRIDHLHPSEENADNLIQLHYADLSDSSSLFRVINEIKPNEIYNLGAQSHVRISFDQPEYTGDVVGMGVTRLLEAVKAVDPKIKLYQASSSEMFGLVAETPQRETTPLHPRSPYGCAKVYAYWITRNYRESYNMFASNGILFNHESPRRGRNFVTRKITRGLCEIKERLKDTIYLGNLDAKRDWGFAGDYVEAMWLMLQQKKSDDFVIATGETHSVREFVEESANEVGFELEWTGQGINEIGKDRNTGKVIVGIDPKYFRPAEVELLLGDATKAKNVLGWNPKTKFKDLVKMMMDSDKEMLKNKDERF